MEKERVETELKVEDVEEQRWDLKRTISRGLNSGLQDEEPRTILTFDPGDPENPNNWSSTRKVIIVVEVLVTVLNSTLSSATPSGGIDTIAKHFHVTSQEQLVLTVSIYLLGYVFGPLAFGPLSETYGRKPVMIPTFFLFTAFTLGCALAPTWPSFLIMRFLTGVGASCPIMIVGGFYADIYADPLPRGRAIASFMAASCFGPILGPIISGFISVVNWRWPFWIMLIIAGASWPLVLSLPETYSPAILKKRAKKRRKETGRTDIVAAIELEDKGFRQMVMITLTRPVRMFLFESIVLFTCLYSALAFGIFYLFFEAYPIIFQGIYGMSPGVSALAFIPIGIGSIIACGIFLWYDSILLQAKKANKPWASREEYRRLPLACVGGPAFAISLFWLGWSSYPNVHWIVPMLAGLPFGIGFLLIFMALLNYLADAYGIYSASALAAAACTRSILGAGLPFAAKPMYDRLGVHWASSLLGFVSLAMTIIPFVFIKYGERIRANSEFCQELAREKEKAEAETEERAKVDENADKGTNGDIPGSREHKMEDDR